MRSILPIPAVIVPIAMVMAGCTGNVDEAGGGDAEAMATHAVVIVERKVDAVDGGRAAASARFVRVPTWSSMNDAFEAIGAALDLPPPGSCSRAIDLAGATHLAVPMVELSNVGPVTLEITGASSTRLVPRQLPDVTDVVTGVVYARAAEAAALPAAVPYLLRVGGAAAIGPFEAAFTAPDDPEDVHLAGEDAPGALVAKGASVDVSWSASASHPSDALYVDVEPRGVRCSLATSQAPDGDGLVHAALSTALLDGAGTLIVHRLRRATLTAPGVDDGEIRFDFARSIAYARVP